LPGPEVWLIIRRNGEDPTVVKDYFSNAPVDSSVVELVRLSKMRWLIETTFEKAKGEVGLDHYEMRSWLGWHHHMLLVSLAHHFLSPVAHPVSRTSASIDPLPGTTSVGQRFA
jgi:SRSO17 transposase